MKKIVMLLFNLLLINIAIPKVVFGAIGVEVWDFNTFKTCLESNDEYHLYLKTNISATETTHARGRKIIVGSGYTVINNKSDPADTVNAIMAVESGAIIDINNCVFNGNNKSTIASANIVVNGTCVVNENSTFTNGTQGIHVATSGTVTVNNGKFVNNTSMGIGSYGTINFNNGSVSNSPQGLHNNGGTLNVNGGDIASSSFGLLNFNNGTIHMKAGSIHGATNGIQNNNGKIYVTGGNIYSNANGINNTSGQTCSVSGGNIYNNKDGILNIGTTTVSGGSIYANTRGINNTGNLTVSSGTIRDNTATNGSAIYQNGTCTITGGSFASNQHVYLAENSRFVSTNTSYPNFIVKPNTYTRGRVVVKTSGESNAKNELSHVTLSPSGKWQLRASGTNIVIWDKSNVITKFVDESGKELADSVITNNWYGEAYTTSEKSIPQYRLKSSPQNKSGTYGSDDITVNYVYELDTSTIVINFVDAISGEVIESVTEVGIIGTQYTSGPKTIDGYALTKEPDNKTVTYEKNEITLTYEYKKISGGVEIVYIDQVTGNEIAQREEKKGLEKDEYITTSKTIPGYNLVVTPSNSFGEMTVDKISVTFEYRKLSNVIVKYIDLNNNSEILESISKTYQEGDEYTSESKAIEGYELVSITDNANGVVANSDITVLYGYKKKTSGVDVEYIDQITRKQIYSTIHLDGLEGASYTTDAKNIEGYELVNTTDNATGTMTVDKITVIYEYRKLSDVTVKYVDLNNNTEISDFTSKTYKEGDNYTTESKSIDGYRLVITPSNANGVLGNSKITVIYGYKKISEGVDVRYIDQVTNEEIIETEHFDGLEKDSYSTTQKEIPGYELVVTPSNSLGEMTVEKITVTYEYRKLSNVIIKYIDENTNAEIVEQTNGIYKEKDTYTTLPKNIEGYVVTREPDNKNGTIMREDIIVTYYYKKVSEGLVVKYVDFITGELLDSMEYTGNEGDEILLEEKEVEGYVLKGRPEDTHVTLIPEYQERTYYYRKIVTTQVIAIDAINGNEIYKDIETGIEGDEYTAIPKEQEGYVLVERPQTETIIMNRNTEKIIYKYKKISGGVIIKYIDDYSGEVLEKEELVGLEGDNYSSSIKEYEKYDFLEIEGNAVGKMAIEPIEIIYHYEKKNGIVEIVYIDEDGNELLVETMEDKVDNTYKVEQKEIPNYRVKENPESLEGVYELDKKVITYVMEKIPGKVIVNLRDENGNIIEVLEEDGYVGEQYEIEIPQREGYYIDQEYILKGDYIDGEKVIEVTYHVVEVAVNTGDINVIAVSILFIIFAIGLVYILKKYKK